jgi:hypothetical protein
VALVASTVVSGKWQVHTHLTPHAGNCPNTPRIPDALPISTLCTVLAVLGHPRSAPFVWRPAQGLGRGRHKVIMKHANLIWCFWHSEALLQLVGLWVSDAVSHIATPMKGFGLAPLRSPAWAEASWQPSLGELSQG